MNSDHLARTALQKAFPGIPDMEARQLLDAGEVSQYLPEKVLCREGAVEDVFYILLDGKVKVTKVINPQEDRFLKHLVPGDFFGEMGIIHDAPRAASVTTTTNSTVLEINKEAFESVMNESSVVAAAMVREVSRRLRENDEMAVEDLRLKASELAQAYQQLADLEQARREFLTTIAHELRTPLTSASGYMQIIRMGMMDQNTLNAALDTIGRNLEQITSLTNDILFLQEMDLILDDFESISIEDVLVAAVNAERPYALEKGVDMTVNVAQDLPPLLGDANSLLRAFRAVINNAVKFSPDGGAVDILASQNPEYLWIRITDQGIGIEPDSIDKIFDRFYRIEEFDGTLFGGVGLGLSIAKQVLDQHGAETEIQSELRRGTIFTIRFILSRQNPNGSGIDPLSGVYSPKLTSNSPDSK